MNSVFAILTLAAVVTRSSDAGSPIHKYSSKETEGVILSNEFPYSYDNTKPEHFYFHAQEDETVQIIFDQFFLYKKDANKSDDRCGTADGSYITYKRTEKNEPERFCGNVKPLPIMSDGREFHLEYFPIKVPSEIKMNSIPIGFNATFRFVKNYGVDSGRQQQSLTGEYSCEFEYRSEDNLTGIFNSPNFPGFYPIQVECFYTFITQFEKNIFFNFTEFNFIGNDDCDADRGKKDTLQIMITSDGSAEDSSNKFCGSKDPFTVSLTNQTVFLVYKHKYVNYTDYENAKVYPFLGFRATFQFTNDTINDFGVSRLPDITVLCICLLLLLKNHIFKF